MHQLSSVSDGPHGKSSPTPGRTNLSLPIDRSILELCARLAEVEKQHREGQAVGASLAARARRLGLLRSVRDCDDVEVARAALSGSPIRIGWFHAIASCACPRFMTAMLGYLPESEKRDAARLLVYSVVKAAQRGAWDDEQADLVESVQTHWEGEPFAQAHKALAEGRGIDIDMGADHTPYNQACIDSLRGKVGSIAGMRSLVRWVLSSAAAVFVNDEDFRSDYRTSLLTRDSGSSCPREPFWSYDPERERQLAASSNPADSLIFGFDLGVLLIRAAKGEGLDPKQGAESLEGRGLKCDVIASSELELYGPGEWLGDRLRRCQDLLVVTGDSAMGSQAVAAVRAWKSQVSGERSEWLRSIYTVSSLSDLDATLAARGKGIRVVPDSYLAWHYGAGGPKSRGGRG